MRSKRVHFSTRDLLMMAALGGVVSTYINAVGDVFQSMVFRIDSMDTIEACADCIVSFRNQGGFSIVAPGFPGNVQVKGVIEIQVK